MAKTENISVDRLRERLRLDDSGVLYWRECPTMAKQWNTSWAGKAAFTATDGKGYRHGSIDYTYVRYHRVVWALVHGAWPTCDLDHIDGDKQNNKISNLRPVCKSENSRNRRRGGNNTSGVMGVGWHKPTGRWRAYIASGSQSHVHLGFFDTKDEAIAARRAAQDRYGYHANHGRD